VPTRPICGRRGRQTPVRLQQPGGVDMGSEAPRPPQDLHSSPPSQAFLLLLNLVHPQRRTWMGAKGKVCPEDATPDPEGGGTHDVGSLSKSSRVSPRRGDASPPSRA